MFHNKMFHINLLHYTTWQSQELHGLPSVIVSVSHQPVEFRLAPLAALYLNSTRFNSSGTLAVAMLLPAPPEAQITAISMAFFRPFQPPGGYQE